MRIDPEDHYRIQCSCGRYRIVSGYDVPANLALEFGPEHVYHDVSIAPVRVDTSV